MAEVYIYIRFSTPKQDKGSSEERQLETCQAMCERRRWTPAEVIRDLGRSAWKGDHLRVGNLGRFAERVRAGLIEPGSILLVEASDRLSRQNYMVAWEWMNEIAKAGVSIAFGKKDRVISRASIEASLMEAMEIQFEMKAANEYTEVLSARVVKSWETKRSKAANGFVISKRVPGWISVIGEKGDPNRKYAMVTDRARIVVRIYEMAATGWGARHIARTLNGEGVASFGGGKAWDHSYVSEILQSAAVEGDYCPGRGKSGEKTGERHVGHYGRAIVDADLVKRARDAVASRKGRGGRGSEELHNLFTGLVACGNCGGPMIHQRRAKSRKGASYLICKAASWNRECSQTRMFNYTQFEEAALDAMLHLALDDRFFHKADTSKAHRIEIAEIEKKIEIAEAGWNLAFNMKLENPSPMLDSRLRQLEGERIELDAKLGKAKAGLTLARGAVSADAHLERVHEVRASLQHEDREIRVTARRKVVEALQGVVTKVTASAIDRRGRPILNFRMELAGGAHNIWLNNSGEVIRESDIIGQFIACDDESSADFRKRCTGGDAEKEAMMDGYLRRKKSA